MATILSEPSGLSVNCPSKLGLSGFSTGLLESATSSRRSAWGQDSDKPTSRNGWQLKKRPKSTVYGEHDSLA